LFEEYHFILLDSFRLICFSRRLRYFYSSNQRGMGACGSFLHTHTPTHTHTHLQQTYLHTNSLKHGVHTHKHIKAHIYSISIAISLSLYLLLQLSTSTIPTQPNTLSLNHPLQRTFSWKRKNSIIPENQSIVVACLFTRPGLNFISILRAAFAPTVLCQ
jgi:hypothetical protein